MEALKRLRAAGHSAANLQAFVDAVPYAGFLGLRIAERETGPFTLLPFSMHLVGNPRIPAIHGGVIGAFLELTALIQLVWESEVDLLPKPVNITVEYLRLGRAHETHGRAIVTKHGKRVANVRAEAWQEDAARPIAAAHAHFLMPSEGQ